MPRKKHDPPEAPTKERPVTRRRKSAAPEPEGALDLDAGN